MHERDRGRDRRGQGVRATWVASAVEGVALVRVRLRNPTPVARVVRVESELEGPVMPPRSAGRPDPCWDEEGFAGVVDPGAERTLGFAVDAPVERPPVAVVDGGRASAADRRDGATPAAACRTLGSPRPPRDAVPLPDDGGSDGPVDAGPVATPDGTPAVDEGSGRSSDTDPPWSVQ